ncbi:MAG: DnaA regulatory inactivator Hda [Rhodocyclales bacterium GWA2_65_20]|nr:MAG: DnaA regulatory inactivator Hda [Rhodocyclales bacterium GWA2_65_20]
MTQLLLDLKPEQVPSLDNFVAGINAELVDRLRGLADPGCFDMVYVWGSEGSGRSHLLAATALLAAPRRPTTLLAAAQVGAELHLAPGGLLIIDDVAALSAAAQVALFRIFNSARLVGLALLLSGATPPLRLELREDLRTRIGQSLIYEVKPLSDEEKAAALRRHALQRGMRIDDGLVQYLLRHGRRDLPTLMAVLDGLDRASLQQQRPATLPLLKEVMQSNWITENDETGSV